MRMHPYTRTDLNNRKCVWWNTVGTLNMCHSNSASKLTIKNLHVYFLIFHQLAKRIHWRCHSTSCLGKVSPGRCNWLHLQCAFITNASESDNGFSQCISFSWKLHSKIYTMYSNGSGTLHWVRREFSQPLHCSYFRRRHMLCCGAFAMEDLQGAFVFAKNGQCNYSRNNWATLAKWLTTGQAEGIVRVDSWAAWLTLYWKASFQCSHSNLLINLFAGNFLFVCQLEKLFFELHILRAHTVWSYTWKWSLVCCLWHCYVHLYELCQCKQFMYSL